MADMYLADPQQIDEAVELMARFGAHAALEAAIRAGASRDKGNHIHFCRWRQTERLIDLMASRQVTGTRH